MALTDEQHEMISNDISNAELNDKRGSYILFEHTRPCLEDVQTVLEACGDLDTAKEYLGEYEKRHLQPIVDLCQEIAEQYGDME